MISMIEFASCRHLHPVHLPSQFWSKKSDAHSLGRKISSHRHLDKSNTVISRLKSPFKLKVLKERQSDKRKKNQSMSGWSTWDTFSTKSLSVNQVLFHFSLVEKRAHLSSGLKRILRIQKFETLSSSLADSWILRRVKISVVMLFVLWITVRTLRNGWMETGLKRPAEA